MTNREQREEALKAGLSKLTYGKIDIKAAVTDNKSAFFRYYTDGELWYATEDNEAFPVPVSDLGSATLRLNEKALLLMRYMRRWNDTVSTGETV